MLNEISSKLDKIIELLSEIKIKPAVSTYSHSFGSINAIGRELITEEKPLPTPWNS